MLLIWITASLQWIYPILILPIIARLGLILFKILFHLMSHKTQVHWQYFLWFIIQLILFHKYYCYGNSNSIELRLTILYRLFAYKNIHYCETEQNSKRNSDKFFSTNIFRRRNTYSRTILPLILAISCQREQRYETYPRIRLFLRRVYD